MSEATRYAALDVAMEHRIGVLALDVSFRLTAPWTVLFAPSGAGKSTVLRVIAGLERPDAGRIVGGDGTVLLDTAAGLAVAPHRRGVRFVGQRTALFPHLTVLRNIAYGAPRDAANDVLQLCRVTHLTGKMPEALSGGERQRVALARALAALPARMVLLDEPFSGLDVPLRDRLMEDVQRWLADRGVPVLHVTHDVGEVFALGAEVIRLDAGRVQSQGPASVVLREEKQWLIGQLASEGRRHP